MKYADMFQPAANIDSGRRHALDWVEDSYSGHQSYQQIGAGFLSLAFSRRKIALVFVVLCVGLGVLLGRSAYLQLWRGEQYLAMANDNRIRTEYVKAPRGIIYDRAGTVLVQNISGFSLDIIPAQLPTEAGARRAVIEQVAAVAQMSVESVEAAVTSAHEYYFQPVTIKSGIAYEEAMRLKIASADLPGIVLESDMWRAYPLGTTTAHILGYIGKINTEEYESRRSTYLFNDNIGKAGLERTYEQDLRGVHGQKRVEVDSLGRPKKVIAHNEAVSGSDLILALDADLQQEIYRILERRLAQNYNASVIVSDPRTGEIIALVDYPSYDNNLFTGGIGQAVYQALLTNPHRPLFMRSILGEYPSGSTVKIVIAAAALQQGIVDRTTTVLSTGGLYIGPWRFPDWRAGGHGVTNVTKAISDSVNTFFYYVGGGYGDFAGLGIGRLAEAFAKFHLGSPLGIDLPGEQDGFIPTPEWKQAARGEPWYIGDTYHVAIGQGDLLVTPLQVNSYTATIANGGTVYRPRLVHAVVGADGQRREMAPEVLTRQVMDDTYLSIVREGMRQTVTTGSARSLNTLPVEIAGKTGTAQWNSREKNHAWFTSFAPYQDPQYVVTVLVEAGGEGSSIATPIARDIYQYIFSPQAGT